MSTTSRQPSKRYFLELYPTITILLFLLLGFAYSLVVPPFETPDESFHYAFARHLSQGNWLPVQVPNSDDPWSHEGSQAPLYYLLTGALTAPIDQSDYPEIGRRNPRANMGEPLSPGNKNRNLYSGTVYPMQGSNLALHVGRWFSLLLGAVTVWYTWRTAKLALPHHPHYQRGAVLLAAVIPQFVFVSASFSNDNMVTVMGSITVYYLAVLVDQLMRGANVSFWRWVGLGILLGLAALSKLSGLGLCLLAATAVCSVAIYRRDWWLPWRILLPVLVPFLLVAGWWYWRNYSLYGDWLGANLLLEINGLRTEEATWLERWGEFRGLRYSFWGLFGWFNIPLPSWIYRVFDWLTLAAGVGLLGQIIQVLQQKRTDRVNSPVLLLLGLWALTPFGLIVYWAQQATSSQGRLLFPSLSALMILFISGLYFWLNLLHKLGLSLRGRRIVSQLVPAFALASTVLAVTILIPQAYYAPSPVATLPDEADSVEITYGDAGAGETQFQLLGLTVGDKTGNESGQKRYHSGERVPVTLYLQALTKPNADYQIFIQMLDETGQAIANLTTHPGWGRNPTSTWTPGVIYPDSYDVLIDGPVDAKSPVVAKVYVGFIDPTTEESGRLPLTARDASGDTFTPIVDSVVVAPWAGPDSARIDGFEPLTPPTTFGDLISLTGFAATRQLPPGTASFTVSTIWMAAGTPQVNYVAYVHLINEAGERVAGYDQPPAGSRFPTRFWQPNDQIQSEFILPLPLDLPAGTYQLWLGLYEEGSQGANRLPITSASLLESADNQVRLGQIDIQ